MKSHQDYVTLGQQKRAPRPGRSGRGQEKSRRIVQAAMRQFARSGYQAARVEDIASDLGIAKGSVFQHFGSKEALFLAAYKEAVGSFSAYLDAPGDVLSRGFFATLEYWLLRTERLLRENWVPYRMTLIGNYASDLALRREIRRFLVAEDPYGVLPFVRMGIARGEVRRDVDPELTASILEWTVERFQDALLSEELDPGLFPHPGAREKTRARVDQFLRVLRGGLAPSPRPPARRKPKVRGGAPRPASRF
ncbi:MAG: TetR/AcrR family transcriptional regulator [Thermoanaerobaculia bacterium]